MASSTLTSWALLLWNTLKSQGYDPRKTFTGVGLDPTKLGDGQARYNTAAMPKLWQAAIAQSSDDDLGITTGKSWHPTTFHALGFSWLASNTLLEAFNRLVRYSEIVNNSLIIKMEPCGAHYQFTLSTSEDYSLVHPAGVDAGLAAIIQMCRLLIGEQFTPVAMELRRPYRAPGVLEAFAGVSAKYEQAENILLIDAATVKKELSSASPSLVTANEQVAIEYLQWLNKKDIVSAVHAKVVELLPTGNISKELVAEKIHMNVHTLQRKLKAENQSFKALVNTTRKEIASTYMNNSQMSLTEIAYLLGFADQANFTRAFKRWTGLSPSLYRKSLAQKKAANL